MNLILQVKRPDFVRSLIDLTYHAISHNLVDDAEELLKCLRRLRPRIEHFDYFDGMISVLRNDWKTAHRIARGCSERTGDWPYANALLALCQFADADPTWRVLAERVVAQDSAPDARQMMLMLLGRADPVELGMDPEVYRLISQATNPSSSVPIKHDFVLA